MKNKYVLLSLTFFVMIFILGIVSSLNWDNVQDYDSIKKEYTITNALGIPFFGKEIAKIKLNTPLNYKVPIGYQRVAEFTVENYDDYVNVFNGMDFYNTKKSNELFVRDFDYKYKTIIQVPNFKYDCQKDDGDNQTIEKCTKFQDGTKDEVTWTEINKSTGLLKGNITIGIFTNVEEGDVVEWIATLYGKRLTAWSVWTASLNVDLIAYWTLDDVYTDSSIFSNTLTPINSTTFNTGIINNGSDFESGSSQYLTRGTGSLYPTIPFTLNMWVKPESVTADAVVINKRSDSAGRIRYVIFRSSTSDRVGAQFYRADATNFVIQSDAGALTNGQWTMITATLNGTHANLYINGSLSGTPVTISDLHNVAEQPFYMGSNVGAGQFWDGIIDETSMWNRSLSPAEVTQLYNNHLAIQVTFIFGPIVTLNSPVEAFNTTIQIINYNGTFSNVNVLANVSLFIDGILNETNSSGINSTNYLFTKTIADGDHNWTYEVCDDIGCGTGTTRNFTIDSSPKINVTSPTNITFQDPTIFFNATTSLGVDNFIINYNGTNVTITVNSSLEVEDGFFQLLLYANDSTSGSFGLNDTIFFTVDTAPVINVNSPTNITHTTSTIFFNATTNKSIDAWIVNYNGTNVTLSDINTTLTVEDGFFQLLLYANNSVTGRFGLNDTIFFSVDTSAPILNITFPLNRSYIDNFTKTLTKSMVFNYTVTDASLDTCTVVNISTSDNISLPTCTNVTFLDDYGQYTFIVYANDTLGQNSSDVEIATFDYKILQNNFSFTNITLEGSLETFTLDFNVSAGITASSVILIYNGTSFSTTLTTSGDNVISSRNIIIPQVTSQTNITFNWNITLSDGFTYNSSSYNQTIEPLALDDCSVFTNLIYNYSIVDEELQTVLSNTIVELNIDFFDPTRTVEILNFSKSYSANPVLVCINSDILASTNYSVDSIIKYEAIGYAIENYNIVDFTLSNSTIPQNITLYDLNSSDSTEFKISFKGEDFVFVENALIFIDRQYISENNSFKTVELPKTDSNGQTVGHFVRNDVIYNIRVIKNGVVLGNFDNIIAFCQDFTIGDCQIVLEATPEEQDTFDYDEEIGLIFQSVPTYDNDTNTISFSFSTDDGTSKTIFMEVTRNDIFGNRTLCNNTITSASGTISCTINPGIDDTVLQTRVFANNQLVILSNVKLTSSSTYGNLGYILWFFLTFVFILIFGSSKTELLIGMFISFAGAITLGIVRGDIVGLGSAGIWVLVIVILGIWKINKENPQ